jgi:hypothetical protein
MGTSEYSANTGAGWYTSSFIFGTLTSNGTDTYEVQHQCATTISTNGFGFGTVFGTCVFVTAEFTLR